jgi:hypothetical protein
MNLYKILCILGWHYRKTGNYTWWKCLDCGHEENGFYIPDV